MKSEQSSKSSQLLTSGADVRCWRQVLTCLSVTRAFFVLSIVWTSPADTWFDSPRSSSALPTTCSKSLETVLITDPLRLYVGNGSICTLCQKIPYQSCLSLLFAANTNHVFRLLRSVHACSPLLFIHDLSFRSLLSSATSLSDNPQEAQLRKAKRESLLHS